MYINIDYNSYVHIYVNLSLSEMSQFFMKMAELVMKKVEKLLYVYIYVCIYVCTLITMYTYTYIYILQNIYLYTNM
jgi:cell division protein FtsL